MSIHLKGLDHAFDSLVLFRDFHLELPDNCVTTLLGPSGCGKTTLLNILAGIIPIGQGQVTGLDDYTIGYLFQDPRLLEWRTVWKNLDIPLRTWFPSAADRGSIISKVLSRVGLLPFKDYYPYQLSGGMRQRLALARAFAFPADLMLLDEPFQALDLPLKIDLLHYFIDFWQPSRRTALFVTHDIQEALILGDELYILSDPPVKIIKHFTNDLPVDQRELSNPRLLALEKEIYSILLA